MNNGVNDSSNHRYSTDGPFILESYEIINNDINKIKKTVAQYGAVGFTLKVPTESTTFEHLLVSDYGQSHAMGIVGWDDSISKDLFRDWASPDRKPSRDGAWIVRNSWGPRSHGDGYFYLSYDSNISRYLLAVDYANRSDYENNYYWDGMNCGIVNNYHIDKKTLNKEVAAVYPVLKASYNKKEFLKAVNVAINGDNSILDVKVYTNLTNSSDPESGNLVFSNTYKYENSGSYTIKMNKEIELEPNSHFSVIAKVINNANNAYISLNQDLSKNDLTFYKNDNNEWINLHAPGMEGNVAKIKAFTTTKNVEGNHNNDLKYATVSLQKDTYRYGFNDDEINPEVILGDETLVKDVDYRVTVKKEMFPKFTTSSNEDIIGKATCIIEGINKYHGTNTSKTFSIMVALIPNPIPDVVEFDYNTKKCILRVPTSIKNYNQIALPQNWKWTFPNQIITFDKNDDNYLQYIASDEWCYRRTMFDVKAEQSSSNDKKINYQITLKKANGVIFDHGKLPTLKIYNSKNELIFNKNEKTYENEIHGVVDGVFKLLLWEDEYRVEVDFNETGYTFNNSYTMNAQNRNLDIRLNATLINSVPPSDIKYDVDQVLHNYDFVDVLGNKLSLKQNCDNKKVTIFVFFRTTCQYSKRTLNLIDNVLKDTKFKNKVDVWCFGRNDTDAQLIDFAKNAHPSFKFINDARYNFKDKFFNDHGVPRTAIVDYHGIYERKFIGEIDNADDFRKTIKELIYK